jgi:hypothetical protein
MSFGRLLSLGLHVLGRISVSECYERGFEDGKAGRGRDARIRRERQKLRNGMVAPEFVDVFEERIEAYDNGYEDGCFQRRV